MSPKNESQFENPKPKPIPINFFDPKPNPNLQDFKNFDTDPIKCSTFGAGPIKS